MQRSSSLIRFLSVFILIAMLAYLGFNLYGRAADPLQTIQAVNATATESCATEGYIVRTEQALSSSGVVVPVESGKKVAKGGTVAVSYTSGAALERADEISALSARIAYLESVISGSSDMSVSSTAAFLAGAAAGRNMDEIQDSVERIKYLLFQDSDASVPAETELASAKAQLATLQNQSGGASVLTAPRPGIFSGSLDGFESILPENISGLSAPQLRSLFSNTPSVNGYGKLVYGTTWYFAAILATDDAYRLKEGTTAELNFTRGFSDTVTMTVEEVSRSVGGERVVLFSCDRSLASVCSVRDVSAEVIFSSQTGILAPKNAVYTDTDGTSYLYKLVGLQAKRVNVEVLCQYQEDYCLVKAVDSETLNTGVEIISNGKNLFDGKVVK